MAGERYAQLQISSVTPLVGQYVNIWLNGAYRRFEAVGTQSGVIGEFYVLTDYQNSSSLYNPRYANTVSLANAITAFLDSIGQRDKYEVYPDFNNQFQFGRVTITATAYSHDLNFEPIQTEVATSFYEIGRLATIRPIFVVPDVAIARCFGSTTASVGLDVSNGSNGVYSYLWSDGATTRDRANIAAGTYIVTVTDTSGASNQTTVVVGQNSQIVLEIVKSSTSLTVVASGGTAPYTYAWSDGPTTAARTGLPPGRYRCEVRDSLGCGAAIEATIDPSRFYFSHDPIILALDAGDAYRADPSTKPDLSFVCEVYVERNYRSGQFELAGQAEEQPADRNGRTVFEVQELLEPFVSPSVPPIDPQYRYVVTRAGRNFLRFYMRYRERTANGLTATFTTEMSYVVYGGLSFEEAARGTWFNGWFERKKPFLTWEPLRKTVQRDQPEFLYYMVPLDGISVISSRARVFLSDGTSQTFTGSGFGGVLRYEVYNIPAGFEELNLGRFEVGGRRVQRWEVCVIDQNAAVVSEVRTYVLDTRYRANKRYFLYANSLGGFNTLAALGRAELQLATKTTSSPLPRVAGYDASLGDVEVDRKTGLPTLKVYTGARSAEQLVADQDFMLSPRVLLYDRDRFRAGVVKDRAISPLDEDATRRVLQFDFEMPRERHYTPRLTVPPATIPLPASNLVDTAGDTP